MEDILTKVRAVETRNATLEGDLNNALASNSAFKRAAAEHASLEGAWRMRELELLRELSTKTSLLSATEKENKQMRCDVARATPPPPSTSHARLAPPAPPPRVSSEDQRRGAAELKDASEKLGLALNKIREQQQEFQGEIFRLGTAIKTQAQAQAQGPAAAEGGGMAP